MLVPVRRAPEAWAALERAGWVDDRPLLPALMSFLPGDSLKGREGTTVDLHARATRAAGGRTTPGGFLRYLLLYYQCFWQCFWQCCWGLDRPGQVPRPAWPVLLGKVLGRERARAAVDPRPTR